MKSFGLREYALALLVLFSVHEFSWMLLPDGLGLQGNWRAITLWPAISCALLGLHALARHRFLSAVCMAGGVMSFTTAGCAAWWFFARWEIVPGVEHCSKQAGIPMLLISAVAALAVFWRWDVKRC